MPGNQSKASSLADRLRAQKVSNNTINSY